MSGGAARVLTVKIGRAANYNGPSLSIGPSDNSLARMNVRYGSDRLHLDPQNCEFWRFSGFRPDRQRDGPKSVLRVGGPIFGKATKVAKSSVSVKCIDLISKRETVYAAAQFTDSKRHC